MGYAARYFYDSTDSDRQTLHRRIRPSETQFEEQQARWNELRDFLLPALSAQSGHPTRSWLQGSYKFGTQIRPVRKGGEFDIDLGVYYCWEGGPNDGGFRPATLKSFAQTALHAFADENTDVTKVSEPAKRRCCRIHFDADFHIDVPCYHLDPEADERALATESDEWEHSDPKALYQWFTSSFDDALRDRVRRFIRYMKAWSALKLDRSETDPPSSVLLTVLVADVCLEFDGELPSPDDEAFAQIVAGVLTVVSNGKDVRNPVDSSENLAARLSDANWNAFENALATLHEIARGAIDCESEVDACSGWALAFEHFFPLPDEDFLVEEARNLPALRTIPEVSVSARSRDNPSITYQDTNRIGPIRKNCDIDFRVTNAHVMPPGTRYMWVVRNEGGEAEEVNDLGHPAGNGAAAREHSAYNGTHYMDCTAVCGGTVVGIRRVKVTIRGEPAARRNPIRKPSYVRIQDRR